MQVYQEFCLRTYLFFPGVLKALFWELKDGLGRLEFQSSEPPNHRICMINLDEKMVDPLAGPLKNHIYILL